MFDWDEFKVLAEKLRTETDEASQRTSISRLYYSVYWKARNHLVATGYIYDPNKSSHKQIWNEYKNKTDTDNQKIGKKGNELHKSRIKADYHEEIYKLNDVLEDSFLVAKEVLTTLQKI